MQMQYLHLIIYIIYENGFQNDESRYRVDPFVVFYFLFYLLLLEFYYTALVFDFCKIWIFIRGINEDFIHSFIYSFIHSFTHSALSMFTESDEEVSLSQLYFTTITSCQIMSYVKTIKLH